MTEKKFLDFIVPTKNRWHLLETTLLSFLAQTNKNFNLLIVDNSDEQKQELLAQKLLEKYKYPYLSIDHLKMRLIRSGNTELTPVSDEIELTAYLWPIVREMIKRQ